jgi:FkbM family methyltransferase
VAVDGGAHVGSMSLKLAQYFDTVWAFEPCEESCALLVDNCQHEHRILPMPMALMDRCCAVDTRAPRGRTTLTARQVAYGGEIRAINIDSMKLECCDMIKLDLEGCEYLALQGAVETIKRFNPFLLIEINDEELGRRFGHSNEDVLKLLKLLGYQQVYRSGVDRGYMHE